MKHIQKLERYFARQGIVSVFQYIVLTMATVYLLSFTPASNIISSITLVKNALLRFELWRIFTFIFVPPAMSPLSAILYFYFIYYIGISLEKRWGITKFLLFYLTGMVSIVLATLLAGIGTNIYLNLSLLFAFSLTYPEQVFHLFFVFPIKVKWIGIFNLLYQIILLISGNNPHRINIAFSFINVLLFLGGDIINTLRTAAYRWNRKKQFRKNFK